MNANILETLQASGASLFAQNARLLTLRFAEGSRIPDAALLPHRLQGKESLSRCYHYQLECLSPDAFVELKALLGQPVEIALLLPEGGSHLFTGLVTESEYLGSDGGFTTFRLTVEPALATLAKRCNSRVFQDKTTPEIVAAILDEHLVANPAFVRGFQHQTRLTRRYPRRSYCIQYRESDLAFIERLLAEEGISYRFTHGPNSATSIREETDAGSDPGTPLHTLILVDSGTSHPRGSMGKVRFHRTDGVEREDAIDTWEGSRTLQSGSSRLATYDYKNPVPYADTQGTWMKFGESGSDLASTLEDYDPQTLYYGADREELERYTALRQQAKDLASKTFRGRGSVRALEVGTWFDFRDHPVQDYDYAEERQFLVTSLDFEARNNILAEEGSGLRTLLGEAGGSGQNQPTYRNAFTAVRRHIPVVPEYRATRHQKPTAPGPTTATVVGPADEEIHVDELGRIKIQFHWQRKADHPNGGADFDERSSTWVRVAYPSAGARWGSQFIPRIGQEVVVDFLEGDIDRPLVTGVVYNGTHRPPDFSDAGQLPANKTLSGVKSSEYKGYRYNELLFDDTTREIRAKLSSEHGKTQLNQGFLIHPRTDGKGDPRGEGFELRTDHQGALRGAKGILISAEARAQAVGKQLDRDMLQGQLQAAEGIAKSLSELSDQHGAGTTETDQQSQILEHIKNWEKGSNTASKENSAEGGKPIIALSGPLGIVAGTPESVTLTAGHNLDLVSVKHTNLSVGGKFLTRVTESVSLFVKGIKNLSSLKLIVSLGHFDIETHDGEIRITGNKKVIITSNEEIVQQAPKITSIAQGVKIELGGGDITTQCSGTHTQKAALHNINGPGGGSVKGAFNPKAAQFDQKAILTWMGTGEPIANRRYRLKLEDGRTLEGTTDAEGRTQQFQSEIGFARYRMELLPDQS